MSRWPGKGIMESGIASHSHALMDKLHIPHSHKKKSGSDRSARSDSSSNGKSSPLLMTKKLNGYSKVQLQEYRQVFKMFDTDRSGAISVDELESATRKLGIKQTREELEMIINEVDHSGNHEIDFDEFCEVMDHLNLKQNAWNNAIEECFNVFDWSKSDAINKSDFAYILRELGDITDRDLINEIFNESDLDGNGVIDKDEFEAMCANYFQPGDI
ncbi:hypothetical protein PMAYCL1PPCAC_28673 [Pristionchus mayeri]|uniref:EF-hand domain-containing protein n=1 Tax=Pristionchus mayeri TaxID=1317129 RepID=A0AAN5D8J4_9BILA|nr:hypothetical protein PMAYCL1PPCAC_28673 [Pristionchus mayeri]